MMTSHIEGALVECMHRGNPTGKRGIVVSVQYSEPRYVVVECRDYSNGGNSTPMYDRESSFKRIPIIFASMPDRLNNAWQITDGDGCVRYIATANPNDILYREDVIALLHATYVDSQSFDIEKL
jgi:hypothetical protein